MMMFRILVTMVVIGVLAMSAAQAQTEGGACSALSWMTTGGSTVITSGSGASTLYTQLICDNTSVFRFQSAWDINGLTTLNIGESTATCDSTIVGKMRYRSAGDAFEYCNGTSWKSL